MTNAEQRQIAADLWTKLTDLSHKPACRRLGNHIHQSHLLLLSPKDTHFTIARSVEGCVDLDGRLKHLICVYFSHTCRIINSWLQILNKYRHILLTSTLCHLVSVLSHSAEVTPGMWVCVSLLSSLMLQTSSRWHCWVCWTWWLPLKLSILHHMHILGDFTFWISPWLSLLA